MTSRSSRSELLKFDQVAETVDLIASRFGELKAESAVQSLVVIGSFTSPEERTRYSDIDIAVVLDDSFLELTTVEIIKELFAAIEKVVNRSNRPNAIKLWPKPASAYEPNEVRDTYFSSLLDIECNTPTDIFQLDGWSGLARTTLQQYELASGVVIYGKNPFEKLPRPQSIPRHEWYELFMISTRDLARGFGLRCRGNAGMGTDFDAGFRQVKEGENAIAKAVLRNAYAAAIYRGTHPLNSYGEVLECARNSPADYSSPMGAAVFELIEDAHKLKTKGEGVVFFCVPKNILGLANPTLMWTAPVATMFDQRIYRQVKQSLFEARSFLPFIEPGNLELYYERTIPRIVDLLASIDIDPLICLLFWEELRDFLISELALFKHTPELSSVDIQKLRVAAVQTMENIFWFFQCYGVGASSMMKGGQYRTMQMMADGEPTSVRINRVARSMLYGAEDLSLNPKLPDDFLPMLIATAQVVSTAPTEDAARLRQKLENTQEQSRSFPLNKRMLEAFEQAERLSQRKAWPA